MRADSLVKQKCIYFATLTPVISICWGQTALQTWKRDGDGELLLPCTGLALGVEDSGSSVSPLHPEQDEGKW